MIDTKSSSSASAAPRKNRRRFRSHLVNHDVRLRLVVDDVIFALIAAFAAIGILYYLGNRELGDSLYSAHLSIKQTRELLTNGVKVAGAVTFLAVLLFGLWSLIDAHRIAGPMHRLHRLLGAIRGGDLTHEIRFRRRDEFQKLAEAADTLVDSYAERLAAMRRQAQQIEAGLTRDSLSVDQIKDLRGQAAELTAGLTFFRLPADGSAPTVDDTPLSGKETS